MSVVNVMSGDRQTRLEELLAHQQHLIDALNTEVTKQQSELDRLGRVVDKLEAKIELLVNLVERMGDDLPQEKPPHY